MLKIIYRIILDLNLTMCKINFHDRAPKQYKIAHNIVLTGNLCLQALC